MVDEDVWSLGELVLYGLKGMAAYADHAHILGQKDEAVREATHSFISPFIRYYFTPLVRRVSNPHPHSSPSPRCIIALSARPSLPDLSLLSCLVLSLL